MCFVAYSWTVLLTARPSLAYLTRQHHLMGVVLFASALYWQTYVYLACAALTQVWSLSA
jgi:hypothetical protein